MRRKRLAPFRILMFQEGEWLCAQSIDVDLSAQARTLPQLYRAINKLIVGHVIVRWRHGQRPFEGLPSAPAKYRKMFEHSKIELPPQVVPIPMKARGLPLPRPAVRVAVTSIPAA